MLDSLYQVPVYGLALFMLVAMLAAIGLGFVVGELRLHKYEGENNGNESLVAALLGLMALVLGFTFSYNLARQDNRKAAIIEEANAGGTAFLRADLLPADARLQMQQAVLAYMQTRTLEGVDVGNPQELRAAIDLSLEKQAALWPLAVSLSDGTVAGAERSLLLSAMNDLIDMHTVRLAAAADRMPNAVFVFAVTIAVMAMFVAAQNASMAGDRPILRMSVYSAVITIVTALILDFDQTSRGLVQLNYDAIVVAVADMEKALGQ